MILGRFEFESGSSSKYWHIVFDRTKQVYLAKWGRIGKAPQGYKEYTKSEADKKIREKIAKGYGLVMGHETEVGSNAANFILTD